MTPGLVLALLALLLALPSPASAALSFCGPADRSCARVTVPLDRSGKVPGQIGLEVEEGFAKTPIRPPLFVFAGGPGQGATYAFDNVTLAQVLGPERRNRNVVVFDQRGTGDSGPLDCPEAQRQRSGDPAADAATCANRLGPRRAFYTTRDSVADIEAVRQRMGTPKIALYGTSYGTKVALAYALAHPGHVDRIVLDSVVPLDGPDSLNRQTIGAIPRVLTSRCGHSCRRFARDPAGQLARLSARLERRRMRGFVLTRRGRPRRASLGNPDLLGLIVQGDLDPLLRAETPGLIRSAAVGDSAPILRALARASAEEPSNLPPKILSAGTYAATICEEEHFPWPRTAPIGMHGQLMDSYIASLPASAFSPFTRDVSRASDAELCRRWPQAVAEPALGNGPMPDVPVLLFAGTQDTRTPIGDARKVAASFRHSTLIEVRGVGHDVLGQSIGNCPLHAVWRFLAGGVPGGCRGESTVATIPPPPRSIRHVRRTRGVRGRGGRTLTAVRLTVSDAAETFVVNLVSTIGGADDPFGAKIDAIRGGGLRSGHFAVKDDRFILKRVSYVPGVTVSGTLRANRHSVFRGRLRIGGRAAARGRLTLRPGHVTGRLGGRPIHARLTLSAVPPHALAARAAVARHRRPLIP